MSHMVSHRPRVCSYFEDVRNAVLLHPYIISMLIICMHSNYPHALPCT
jgi:hypothetical protein